MRRRRDRPWPIIRNTVNDDSSQIVEFLDRKVELAYERGVAQWLLLPRGFVERSALSRGSGALPSGPLVLCAKAAVVKVGQGSWRDGH